MKIILLEDNKKLGKKGDIVNVSDGFALNSLIPQGKAKCATKSVIAQVENMKKHAEAKEQARRKELQKDAARLDKKKVTITAQAKDQKLFGSVTAKDIAEEIKKQHDIDVTEEMVVLEAPIKEVTTREVVVEYAPDITAGVILTIVGK